MAVVIQTPLEHALRELLRVVVDQTVQTARFKTPLKRLEQTLKSMKPMFYVSEMLNHPEKKTKISVNYLEKGKELVLKSSRINLWNLCQYFLHFNRLMRLNNQIARFFHMDLKNNISPIGSLSNPETVYPIHCRRSFSGSSRGKISRLPYTLNTIHAHKISPLPYTLNTIHALKTISFHHISFSFSIQPIFALQNLQRLSFSMCEIGDALMTRITESPYMLPNLRDFGFDRCYDLKELPSELCNLARLRRLAITNCHELKVLPEELGSLSNLEILMLRCCIKLQEIPKSIGSLNKLSFLDISDCLNISVLPEEIGELCGLLVLKMSTCPRIQELPMSISKLWQLKEVICDKETSYLWMNFESDLFNLKIDVVEDDGFETEIIHYDKGEQAPSIGYVVVHLRENSQTAGSDRSYISPPSFSDVRSLHGSLAGEYSDVENL